MNNLAEQMKELADRKRYRFTEEEQNEMKEYLNIRATGGAYEMKYDGLGFHFVKVEKKSAFINGYEILLTEKQKEVIKWLKGEGFKAEVILVTDFRIVRVERTYLRITWGPSDEKENEGYVQVIPL